MAGPRRPQGTWAPWLEWAAAHGLNVDDPVPRGKLDREALRAKAPSAAVRLPPSTPPTLPLSPHTHTHSGPPFSLAHDK